MHSSAKYDVQATTIEAGKESGVACELSLLRDVFRLLPAGVTLQDERGEFLLAN